LSCASAPAAPSLRSPENDKGLTGFAHSAGVRPEAADDDIVDSVIVEITAGSSKAPLATSAARYVLNEVILLTKLRGVRARIGALAHDRTSFRE